MRCTIAVIDLPFAVTLPPMSKESATLPERETAGIYLHIPFCNQACVYCNFHFSTSLKYKRELLDAMMLEIELQRNYLQGTPVTTIYFGGGTPSLLTSSEINQLIDTVCKYHNVENLEECTLEANPDDLSKNYIASLKNTPVNRLSIGVQSFKEEDLLFMNRSHNAQQADYAIKAAQDAGITNLSIDLIYGTPKLTDNEWNANLNKIEQLGIPHFSAYALTVEDKTALQYSVTKKKTPPMDPEQAAGQFELLTLFAANNGYEHYEISNLAQPGMHAVHNTNYWKGKQYLGIGPSAHSFNGVSRQWNIANNASYTKSLLSEKRLTFERETLTKTQALNEYIMTSVRTMWGCDLDVVSSKWGNDYRDQVERNAVKALNSYLLDRNGAVLLLTAKGKLFADRIASELFM